jgi:hypothetical protein
VSITPESAHDLARVVLADAYRMRLRRAGKTVEHPIAVGELLTDDRQPPTVVVAGLLHDVLEDTDVTPAELRTRFGPDIARLVEALTQDTASARRRCAGRSSMPTPKPRSCRSPTRLRSCRAWSTDRKTVGWRITGRRSMGSRRATEAVRSANELREQLERWPEQ